MTNSSQAVNSNVLPVNQHVATLAEFSGHITKCADMLVSVEKLEGNIEDAKAGISSILYGVFVSQCESVLNGEVYAGEPVTLGWFDAVRLSWGDAYNKAKGGKLEAPAINTAFSRSLKLVTNDYGFTKPLANTSESARKSDSRAKEAEVIAALIDSASVGELKDKAKALFNKAGDGGKAGKDALAQAKLITKAIDKATSEEAELVKAQTKAVKDAIKNALKSVDDYYVLCEVRDLLEGAVPSDVDALI
jgi:hypothetical protein